MIIAKQTLIGTTVILSIALVDNYVVIESEPSFEDMLWIESGSFLMGSDRGMPDESPSHEVSMSGFWIDTFEVSNADYQQFISATDYLTKSELSGDSMVFESPVENLAAQSDPLSWWDLVIQADWRHPLGLHDTIEGKSDHPVVHVSYVDALAYCDWLDKDLPTEAQFEFAARGGKQGEMYSWGDAPLHHTTAVNNSWQANSPAENQKQDGYQTTSPVGSFPPNDFGLYDISGNVWEWVSDWYHPEYYSVSPSSDPLGVTEEFSIDPAEPATAKRSIRGGSFLCSDDYCTGFRVSARMPADPNASANHTGFRCVKNTSWTESLLNQIN